MGSAEPDSEIVLLGQPLFLRNGRSVQFPTRKSFAICLYLAAHPGLCIDRQRLCGLLWAEFEAEAARVSLRKALSLISTNEDTQSFIRRERGSASTAVDPQCTDLANFVDLIAVGTESAYRQAIRLWRGEPLEGAEIGEEAFDTWVQDFRTTTTAQILRQLNADLAAMDDADLANRACAVALCELIVHIDPAEVAASERLVRVLARQGDSASAIRRLRILRQALDDLDVPLPSHLVTFEKALRGASLREAPGTTLEDTPFHGIPTVILQKPFGMPSVPDLFSYTHSEVMCQLTRFRSLRSFEPMDLVGGTADQQHSIHLDGGLDHDYRLLLWNEPNARALYLRCVSARRQLTVSCVRLGYDELADRQQADLQIARAINAIEHDILNEEAVHPNSAFARWLSAYREMQKFNAQSDKLAEEILTELRDDPRASRLSLVHSGLSALYLKRCMYGLETPASDMEAASARASIQTALSLDDQEPFNHVTAGWMAIQSRQHERARACFETALSLNPYSSRTLISAAEAIAFCGDLPTAKSLAERAMALSGRYAPSYFHSYLATIAYLEGDLEECARRLYRAPENGHTLILAIAVHQERQEIEAAAGARGRFEEHLRRREEDGRFDYDSLSNWVVTANMTKDASIRRRMFGALEQAGLPVGLDYA